MRTYTVKHGLEKEYLHALFSFVGTLQHDELTEREKEGLRNGIEHAMTQLDEKNTPYWVQNHILFCAQDRETFKGIGFNNVLYSGRFGLTKNEGFEIKH